MKRLKQVGPIWKSVKEFKLMLLDIQNMFDEYKLYNFISGMHGWTQNDLCSLKSQGLPREKDMGS